MTSEYHPSITQRPQNTKKGITALIIGSFFAVLMDAIAKQASLTGLSVMQIICYKYFMGFVLIIKIFLIKTLLDRN